LGTLSATPLELVAAYAALANGGFRVAPYLVSEVRHVDGEVLSVSQAPQACPECVAATTESGSPFAEADSMEELLETGEPAADPQPAAPATAPRVMDARAAYMIDTILKDAVKRGTGRRALELKRDDIAGKTGTTNGPTDAWFSGYVGTIVTTAWVGFDQNLPLGRQEYGGSAALPIWVDYMRLATRDLPTQVRPRPDGLVSVRVDPQTGLLAAPGQKDAVFELFPLEHVPTVTPNGDEFQDPFAQDEYNTHEIF
jgi:penicillin-binding protein 1A